MMVIRQQPVQLASEWNEKTKYSLKSTQMLAQMLAHEVKNPLAHISGAQRNCWTNPRSAAEDRELVNLIAREALRIKGLVDKFNIFYEVPRNQYKLRQPA